LKTPFLPFEASKAKKYSRVFNPIARKLVSLKPSLKAELAQLDFPFTPVEYFSVTILTFFYVFVMFVIGISLVVFLLSASQFHEIFSIILLSGFVLSLFITGQVLYYPSMLLKKKAEELNKDILFALRHLLIQVRSGVPLYNAIVSVSEAGYGVISKEFEITAKEINGGTPELEALDRMMLRTPSVYLRRAVWQISNALRAGTNLADVLEGLVRDFSEEERVRLQRFSKELSPWALMYLLLTVIFPTMGIALIMVLSSLMPITISNGMFVVFLGFFSAFQLFFVKFLKMKRPKLRF